MIESREVKEEYLQKQQLNYHKTQFEKPYRSTYYLGQFIKQIMETDKKYYAIDVACGAGANIYYLSKILPKTAWTGIDWADIFFDVGRNYLKKLDCILLKGDLYEVCNHFKPNSFDIAFSIQTLSWLPKYEEALEQLIEISKKWIIITSLFTDCEIDAIIKIYQDEFVYNYNIYNFNRFKRFCFNNGIKRIIEQDFRIDIDLPKPEHKKMGTYTVKTIEDERIQISGPLLMPWKFIALEK